VLRLQKGSKGAGNDQVMIIGAGAAGKTIIHEYMTSERLHTHVCCVIDDNPGKKGRYIDGVPIVGNRKDIAHAVEEFGINKIIVALPGAPAQARKEIINICSETSCKVQTVPGIFQLVDGEVSVSKLRDVQIEDLLAREQVEVSLNEINTFIEGKTVLVTGGGGSIGSELCRQIVSSRPGLLIILDIYENNAYAIQQELIRHYGARLPLVTLIGSVRDENRVNSIFRKYKPQIVFHAAAHKHVPLMEDSPDEAIKNNVLGTCKVAKAALENGTERFVLISTDKAVNPTNIMGASKRLCEMVIQMMNRQAKSAPLGAGDREAVMGSTEFVAVRFGNVLGSNGSVIPLFKKQIKEGGPVTVTDPRIIRYFMTIPEAVSLVLQAGYYAKGGEIFVLDMGDPVKIDDMARKLIRLSGYIPDVDIPIQYTGLRPGEKLFEEMLMDEEGLKETPNHLIHIGEPIDMDDEKFMSALRELDKSSHEESEHIKELVAEIVPTYQPYLKHSTNAEMAV
jgi:FlaA1/EpsC-like NDP-sugar epimerase